MLDDRFQQNLEPQDGKPHADYTRFHVYEPGTALLFYTKEQENSQIALKLLDESGIPYEKVLADENFALVNRYGIRFLPVLVVVKENDYLPYFSVPGVKLFIQRVQNGEPVDALEDRMGKRG